MLRTSPAWLKALLLGHLVSAAGSLAWLYLTLWLVDERGRSPGVAGLITAVYGAGAIGGNLVGGSLGDRFGLRRALAVSKALAVLTCLAFPLCPDALLLPLALLSGLTGGAGRPLMSAVVATALLPELRREGIALSREAFNAGTVLGPPLGGLLALNHFGWVFVIDGVTSAVLLLVVLSWPSSSSPSGRCSTSRPPPPTPRSSRPTAPQAATRACTHQRRSGGWCCPRCSAPACTRSPHGPSGQRLGSSPSRRPRACDGGPSSRSSAEALRSDAWLVEGSRSWCGLGHRRTQARDQVCDPRGRPPRRVGPWMCIRW